MHTILTLHRARLLVGCALIGSVLAGVLFGWFDTPFDPRIVGAGAGVLAGLYKLTHVA